MGSSPPRIPDQKVTLTPKGRGGERYGAKTSLHHAPRNGSIACAGPTVLCAS